MKVVQLCAVNDERHGSLLRQRLYALCDDGSIWTANENEELDWHRVNPPPGCEVQDG